MKCIIVLFICLVWTSFVSAQTYDLPSARRITWSAGSDQWNGGVLPSYSPVVPCTGLTEGDGTTDNTTAINTCITNAAADSVVFIPAGIYYVNGNISLKSRVVLRGAGAGMPWLPNTSTGTTTLKFGASGRLRLGSSAGQDTERVISSGYTKGSTSLTMATGHGFVANDWISVYEDGDANIPTTKYPNGVVSGDGCNWCGNNNGSDLIQQFVQVLTVDGNNITISRPLYWAYEAGNNPAARKMTWSVQKAGVENLKINGSANTGNGKLIETRCLFCWVKGVETYHAGSSSGSTHISLRDSHGVEIRDSYLHYGYGSASGQNYGIGWAMWNSDTKVENNILRHHRHSLAFEGGGSGVAILYNYIDDNYTDDLTYLGSARTNHGAHPMMDLYEGNSISHIYADAVWGSSSHVTFFRNWLRGEETGTDVPSYPPDWGYYAVDIGLFNTHYSFVGNVLGESAWTTGTVYQDSLAECQNHTGHKAYRFGCSGNNGVWNGNAAADALKHGNYDYVGDSVAYWDGGEVHALPDSFYYATRPTFLHGYTWPTFGSDLSPLTNTLPANSRFLGTTPAAPTGVQIISSGGLPTLQWVHVGTNVTSFQVLVDSTTSTDMGLPTVTDDTYAATLLDLTAGAHQLAVKSCNTTTCATSAAITVVRLK